MEDSRDFTPPTDRAQRSSRAKMLTVSRRARLRRRAIHWLPQASFLFVALLIVVGTGLQLRSSSSQPANSTTVATTTQGASTASQASQTVYSVSDVIAGLWQDPTSWVGRTILVNGVLQGPFVFCGETNPCPPSTLGLVNDGNGVLGSDQYLPVIASATQHLQFNLPLTYSVQIQDASAACALNPAILCYRGVIQ
jgi:hypothetical protein